MDTKTSLVLKHLKNRGSITSWDAIERYHATRLSSIIFNLRKKHNIRTVMREGRDDVRYAVYIYDGEKEV